MKEYYEILGLTEEESKLQGSAFDDVCKKKYRRLSMEWHPDRHVNDSEDKKKEAEEKFKKIAEAYSVLSDKDKRANYDNGGDFDFNGAGFDPFDTFRRHSNGGGFGGFDNFGFNFGGFGGFGQQQRQNVGSDIEITVNLTFKEAYNGGEKEITFERDVPCSECNGTGSADGKKTTCPHCNGTGMITQTTQRGNMIMQQMTPCPHCHGTGTINNNPCKKCNGKGTEKKKVTEHIHFPSGIDKGMVMPIQGKGNAAVGGGIPGNLIVNFVVAPDDYFTRIDQLNLVHYEKVPFNEVLLGFEKEFDCPDGSKFKVKVPKCSHDGCSFIKKGKGMPNVNNPSQVGDYSVVIQYEYPDKLTIEQEEKLKNFYK